MGVGTLELPLVAWKLHLQDWEPQDLRGLAVSIRPPADPAGNPFTADDIAFLGPTGAHFA